MAVWFYAAPIVYGANVIVEGVGAAAASSDADALSVTPSANVGIATATSTATAVGSYIFIHHVALPRPAPGETVCDC
jgi:hypothetical protein